MGVRTIVNGQPQLPVVGAGTVQLAPTTFANLPPSPVAGWLAYITDSNTNVWGATAAAGGSNKVLVVYNGTNWTVVGK